MDDCFTGFGALKVSALSKSKLINQYVDSVTIGPNSKHQDEPKKLASFEKKVKAEVEVKERKTRNDSDSPYKFMLAEMELERKQSVQDAIENRRKTILEFTKNSEVQQREEWNRVQQNLVTQMQQLEIGICRTLEQHDRDSSKKQEKLVQYYQQLAERRRKNDRAIKEKEERHQQLNKIMDTISKAQQNFRYFYLEIIQSFRDCTDEVKGSVGEGAALGMSNEVKESLKDSMGNMKLLPLQMEEIVSRCKAGTVTEQDSLKSLDIVQQAKKYKEEIALKISEFNQAKQTAARTAEETAKKQAEVKIETSKSAIESFVSKSAFKWYSELQLFLQNHEESFKPLIQDAALKNFKFDCKKAVNIPVNALSAVRSDHLMDKYQKLCSLLAGQSVKIADAQINASSHPQGVAFCMDLLSQKFVLQGDLMISSNPEAAFGYSAIIVALWNDFPEFGKILLAHFHRECPYLVPIYFPRNVEQSDEDYYTSIGYKYKDGAVEKQDKFLKRMTGIFRLYFSIMITKPKRGQKKNPHDLLNGWRWISNVLNLEPRMDVTATALLVFLEVVGFAMELSYGKQFKKLVNQISGNYMELLKKNDSGGPAIRLELLLEEYKKNGRFMEPKNTLPNNFW